ncbi:MAG: cyclic nucleotide-binding domain-containing protein [Balneolaceae bacterium]
MKVKGLFSGFYKRSRLTLKSKFIKNLTPLERHEFIQFCHRRCYKEGEYIYYQGDPGTGMYFIEEGRIQLMVTNSLDNSEQGTTTFDIEAPDSFGALAIGYELRRLSSARALSNCTLLGFFKPDFETLKKRHPVIALKFMESVAMLSMRQLERTTSRLEEATDTQTAFSIHFNTYHSREEGTEES